MDIEETWKEEAFDKVQRINVTIGQSFVLIFIVFHFTSGLVEFVSSY